MWINTAINIFAVQSAVISKRMQDIKDGKIPSGSGGSSSSHQDEKHSSDDYQSTNRNDGGQSTPEVMQMLFGNNG